MYNLIYDQKYNNWKKINDSDGKKILKSYIKQLLTSSKTGGSNKFLSLIKSTKDRMPSTLKLTADTSSAVKAHARKSSALEQTNKKLQTKFKVAANAVIGMKKMQMSERFSKFASDYGLKNLFTNNWEDLVSEYNKSHSEKIKSEYETIFTANSPVSEYLYHEARLRLFGEFRKVMFLEQYKDWKDIIKGPKYDLSMYKNLFDDEINCNQKTDYKQCLTRLNHFYDFGSMNPTSDWDVCCVGPHSYNFVEKLMELYKHKSKTAALIFDNNWYLAPVLSMLMNNSTNTPVVKDFQELNLYTLPWRFTKGASGDKDFRDVVIVPTDNNEIKLEKEQLGKKIDKYIGKEHELSEEEISKSYTKLVQVAKKIDECVYQNVGWVTTDKDGIKNKNELFQTILQAHETSMEAYFALSTMFVVVYFLQAEMKDVPERLNNKNFLMSAYENYIDFKIHFQKGFAEYKNLPGMLTEKNTSLLDLGLKVSKYLYRVMLSLKLIFAKDIVAAAAGRGFGAQHLTQAEAIKQATNISNLDRLYQLTLNVLNIRSGKYTGPDFTQKKIDMINIFCKEGEIGTTLLQNLESLEIFCNPFLQNEKELNDEELKISIENLLAGLAQGQ